MSIDSTFYLWNENIRFGPLRGSSNHVSVDIVFGDCKLTFVVGAMGSAERARTLARILNEMADKDDAREALDAQKATVPNG